MKKSKYIALVLIALIPFFGGCQVAFVYTTCCTLPEHEACDGQLTMSQAIYKANAGTNNKLDQNTDAEGSIPASLLGTENPNQED